MPPASTAHDAAAAASSTAPSAVETSVSAPAVDLADAATSSQLSAAEEAHELQIAMRFGLRRRLAPASHLASHPPVVDELHAALSAEEERLELELEALQVE